MTTCRNFRRHVLSTATLLAMTPAAFAADSTFTSGTYAGPNPIAAGDTLTLGAGGYKYLNSALTNNGTINASDDLYFQSGNVLSNAGLYDWKTDSGFGDGGYNGSFANSGTLRKSAGSGTSYVRINGFSNSGTIDARTGTIDFDTAAIFNAGSAITGAGQVVVSNGATFNGAYTTAGNLTLTGGTYFGNSAKMAGDTTLVGGSLTGTWEVAASKTLALVAGGYKYLDGTLVNNGSIVATDILYFQSGNTLTNNGTTTFKADVGLGDGGYSGSFVNNGTLSKGAGTGTSFVSINGFSNNGTVDVQTGTIEFNTGAIFNAGSAFTGAGQVVVSNGATFNGAYTTAGNLTLTGGTYFGNSAKMAGDTTLVGGSLTGTWEVAASKTLALVAGGYKYLDGTLVNNGSIVATDILYFQSGNTLTNNGTTTFKADVGLGDGGYSGSFVNNGTLSKGAGTGTSFVSINGFSNNGTVDVQTGTIEFNSGAQFGNGSRFTGAGQVVISSGAGFAGGFTTANNLTFTGGTFNGSSSAPATLKAGTVTWTGGSLTGNWQTNPGSTLVIAPGGYKYVNGTVETGGHTVATDTLYLQSGNILRNTGVYEVKGDVGVQDGGYNGQFINSGTFLKSAGTGATDVSGIAFSNPGTVDVRSGTVVLPTNFSNPGTLTGSGALTTNLLTNSGHVSPGTGAGMLTLNGNFVQTMAGFMDIQLASSASFDQFIVNGTAALAGTLSLSCISTCSLHTGDVYTILDATGGLSGTFASVTASGFGTGFAYGVVYDYADDLVKLVVSNAGAPIAPAVPEPETWALMFAGIGAMGVLARRRRTARN